MRRVRFGMSQLINFSFSSKEMHLLLYDGKSGQRFIDSKPGPLI